jgi:hypothetical protein
MSVKGCAVPEGRFWWRNNLTDVMRKRGTGASVGCKLCGPDPTVPRPRLTLGGDRGQWACRD